MPGMLITNANTMGRLRTALSSQSGSGHTTYETSSGTTGATGIPVKSTKRKTQLQSALEANNTNRPKRETGVILVA